MAKEIKNTAAQRVRAAIARNPDLPTKEIAKIAGTTVAYVYSVRYKDNKAASPEVTKFMGATFAKDDITNITDEQFERLRLNLTKPRQRMQSSQTEMVEPQADPVNHPSHYKYGGIETIDFIEAKELGYNLGNVVKYITRADHKGNRKQDLEKALWYLNRELNA
jgi:hypothetical protein